VSSALHLNVSDGVKTGRTRMEQMSSAVHQMTNIGSCFLAGSEPGPHLNRLSKRQCPRATKRCRPPSSTKSTMCIWQSAVSWISHPPPAGSTISEHGLQNCARMNVASVFDRLVGRYVVGALSFSLFLKIGPVPTPGTPGFDWTRRASRLVLAPCR
jgi:hypothetical protein